MRRSDAGALATALVVDPKPFAPSDLARRLAALMFGDEDAVVSVNTMIRRPESALYDVFGLPPHFEDCEGGLIPALRAQPQQLLILDHAEQYPPELIDRFAREFARGRVRANNRDEADCTRVAFVATMSQSPSRIQVSMS